MDQNNPSIELLYTIEGLKEWIVQNKSRLRGGIAKPFSLIDQDFNICYWQIESFLEYGQYFDESIIAINELKQIDYFNNAELKTWCYKNQELGNKMFSFAIFYLGFDGDLPEDRIRVYESFFCESKPFQNLIFLSNIYQLILIDISVLKFTDENIVEIQIIIKTFFKEKGSLK